MHLGTSCLLEAVRSAAGAGFRWPGEAGFRGLEGGVLVGGGFGAGFDVGRHAPWHIMAALALALDCRV